MKKVINFTRIRFLMFGLSLFLILGGAVGTYLRGGFNMGIEFSSGISQRVQIAPPAFSLTYTGPGTATLDIKQSVLKITVTQPNAIQDYPFTLSEYDRLDKLITALKGIDGVAVEEKADGSVNPDTVLNLDFVRELGVQPVYVNMDPRLAKQKVNLEEVTAALSSLDRPLVQAVGPADLQEFIIKLKGSKESLTTTDESNKTIITKLLEEKFGTGEVLVKQIDTIGPSLAQTLGYKTIVLGMITLFFILIYIWIRFKLGFAVSAVIALAHDVLVIIGFIGVMQIEVSTATIAAILFIIGYSLNDTIVVFDRIRENVGIMKSSEFMTIINTSITQSLSRTIITSLTTLLAVLAIYIFGAGLIKDFSLSLLVGIVVGTYSSIFVASPILLGFTHMVLKRKAQKDITRYGARGETVTAAKVPGAEITDQKQTRSPYARQKTPALVAAGSDERRSVKKKKRKKK